MSFCEIHLTASSESCWECEKIPTREDLEKTIELQKSVIAHMTKRQHEADEVIAFYADEMVWTFVGWNKCSSMLGDDHETLGTHSDAFVGGKRAREYQKKYESKNIQPMEVASESTSKSI